MHPHSQISLRFKRFPKVSHVIVFPLALIATLASATSPRISQITPPQFGSDNVRAVDMDGDGDMDLLREGNSAHESTWIENLGNRMFSESRVFRFDQSVGESLYGDLDGDGRIDALQIGRYRIQESIEPRAVHASLSGQNLSESSCLNMGMTAGSFQLMELHGDARAEIVRLEPGEAGNQALTIGNLLEDGSIGILAGPYVIPAGVKLGHAKAVDVDGDGDLDLHVGAGILERTGPQTFAPVPHPAAKPDFVDDYDETYWADLDGDGLPDVFTLAHGSLKWAKNSGAFSFVEQAPVGIEGSLLKVVDVPASGAILTIAEDVSNGDVVEWHLKQVLATGVAISDIVLDSSNWPATVVNAEPSLVWDLDNDGHTDIFRSMLVSPNLPSQPYEMRFWPSVDWGNAVGFDVPVPIVEAPLCGEISSSLGDMNGDGHSDLVVGPDVMGRFAMLVNDGLGHFSRERFLDELLPAELEEIGVQIDSIMSGDVDADGDADLVVSLIRVPSLGSSQGLTYFALNAGSGTFSIPEFPVGTFDFITGGGGGGTLYDWDGDGDLDLVASSWFENEGGVLSQSSTPLMSGATVLDIIGNPILLESFRIGDLDGDGRSDIISEAFDATLGEFGMIETSTAGIGFSDEFGVIEEIAEVPLQIAGTDYLGNPVMVGGTAIIDVNQDGHNDLVYTSITGRDLLGNLLVSTFWKRNPGNGSRLVADWITLPLQMLGPRSEAGDFNGDGVADYSNGNEFLTPLPSGPLVSPTFDFTGGRFLYQPYAAHIADLDGDGDEDLIVKRNGELNLVRNLIIDERSGVAARLREEGVLGELANPDEDADGDGRSNALEFLQGTAPLIPDAAKPERSQPTVTVDGPSLEIRYENRSDAAELNLFYQLERSENLRDWSPVGNTSSTHHPLAAGWQETVIADEEVKAHAFYRVHSWHEVPTTK